MDEYAVHSYGLVLTANEIKKYLKTPCISDYRLENGLTEDEAVDMSTYDIYDWLIQQTTCTMLDPTYDSGEMQTIMKECELPFSLSERPILIVIEADKTMTLIGKTPYETVHELIMEMYKKIGKYLPDNFDYKSHLVEWLGIHEKY